MNLGRIAVLFFRALALAASLAGFAGCAVFSPAGTIRVDVEVYKGPLSKEPHVQIAELVALWEEFNKSLNLYEQAVCAAFIAQVVTTRQNPQAEARLLADVPGCGGVGGAGAGSDGAGIQTKGASAPLVSTSSGAKPPAGDTSQTPAAPPAALVPISAEAKPAAKEMTPTGAPPPAASTPETAPSASSGSLQQKCVTYYGSDPSQAQKAEGNTCFYLAQVHIDAQDLRRVLQRAGKGPDPKSLNLIQVSDGKPAELSEEVRPFLIGVSHAAMQARAKAYFWAHGQVSFPVRDRTTRTVVNNFTNVASEYGNQLSARADALLKQFSGRDARYQYPDYFPQNIYLRDSQPTDFLNLYVWNRAAAPAIWEDMVLHPVESFSSEETANRVRTFERLYADNYWSRINTVSAVGTGEFRIALVKDDIGNWNLKSFDSDPTELLQAYKNASLALIQKAVALAQETANPAGGVSGLLGMANQLALGGAPASPGSASSEANAQVGVLRRQAMERMSAVKNNAAANGDTAGAISAWKAILDDHARVVSALSEAALSKGSDPAATAAPKPDAAASDALKKATDRIR